MLHRLEVALFSTVLQAELERYLVAFGAEVNTSVTEETTHVISWIKPADSRLAHLISDASPSVHLVTPQWAWDSINTESRHPEQPYLVPWSE